MTQTAAAPSNPGFADHLAAVAAETDALLGRLLTDTPADGETARPSRLLAAMQHAALAGGKRLRPFLTVESAALFDVPRQQALLTGAALECVHCYSLVHDDLPAMDDDDLRRGQPTVHKAFDEATAILAGDSLLTYAFDILGRPDTHPSADVRIRLVSELARASGVGGMAGGQMLDLAAEGRFGDAAPGTEASILMLQSMKTGALIRYGCRAGALLAQAPDADADALDRYGIAIGQAFQIADDLLDVEGDAATVGKATGKDAASGKATLVGLLGIGGAKARLAQLIEAADSALERFGEKAAVLRSAARFIVERRA